MTAQAKQVLREAVGLPPIERAELVEEILASFNFPSRAEVASIPASKVFEKI